mmetsp:Transcript_48373/g.72146  ORF Transcript_48373/g.72146 Transcript_48373/m.72146 type:complete len:244 (+) Transcript_48373:722-1453(+)
MRVDFKVGSSGALENLTLRGFGVGKDPPSMVRPLTDEVLLLYVGGRKDDFVSLVLTERERAEASSRTSSRFGLTSSRFGFRRSSTEIFRVGPALTEREAEVSSRLRLGFSRGSSSNVSQSGTTAISSPEFWEWMWLRRRSMTRRSISSSCSLDISFLCILLLSRVFALLYGAPRMQAKVARFRLGIFNLPCFPSNQLKIGSVSREPPCLQRIFNWSRPSASLVVGAELCFPPLSRETVTIRVA